MDYLRVTIIIVLIVVAFGSIYFTRTYSSQISVSGKFLLITGSTVSLLIGIGLALILIFQAISKLQIPPLGVLNSFNTKKINFEERARDMYQHMAKYLSIGDYISAQYALEFDVGQLASELVHHNNPETRKYLLPVGLAATVATNLCKERIGKMPSLGRWLKLAYDMYSGPLSKYDFEGKNISSRTRECLYDFADLTHKRFDEWIKYHGIRSEQRNPETWIKYWKDVYVNRKWKFDPNRFGSLYDHLYSIGNLYKEIVEKGVDKK